MTTEGGLETPSLNMPIDAERLPSRIIYISKSEAFGENTFSSYSKQ